MAAQIIGPAIGAIASSMFSSYSRAAFGAYGASRARASSVGVQIGDFNLLQVLEGPSGGAALEIANLDALRRALREFAPDMYRKLNRNLKKVGAPAQDKVQEAFRKIPAGGPRGNPRRPGRVFDKFANSSIGRLSWINSKMLSEDKAISLNLKNRNAKRDFAKIQNGQDGTLSIVKVSVSAPAYVVADVAGSSGNGKMPVGNFTRFYDTNRFGRGIINTRHRMTPARRVAIDDWIDKLNEVKRAPKASRYAWPAVDKHMPAYRKDTSDLLNQVIAELNRRLA